MFVCDCLFKLKVCLLVFLFVSLFVGLLVCSFVCVCVVVCGCVCVCGVAEHPATTLDYDYNRRGRGSHLPSHANEAMEVWPEALRDASMRTCK